MDVDFYFSIVTVEFWFKASLDIKKGKNRESVHKKKVINEINDMKVEVKLWGEGECKLFNFNYSLIDYLHYHTFTERSIPIFEVTN